MKAIKIIVSILIVISLFVFYFIDPPNKSRLFSKRFYKKEFYGIVKEKFTDSKNHNSKVLKIIDLRKEGAATVMNICTPSGNENIYPIINLGDTLYKNGYTSKMTINGLLNDTTIVFKLKYP